MFKVVNIGEHEVAMLSNATTPYRFKQLYGADLMKAVTELQKNDISEVEDITCKLAFLMNAAAEKKDMNKLSIEAFYEWLERFEPMEIIKASKDIIGLYLGQTKTSSNSKNE